MQFNIQEGPLGPLPSEAEFEASLLVENTHTPSAETRAELLEALEEIEAIIAAE